MTIRSAAWALAAVMVAAPSWAQDHRIEVSGLAGWTFSDGVTGDGVLAADGNVYNEIGPKDSFNWGLTIAYNFTDNYALEFMYDQQLSTLEVAGTRTTEIGDFKVATYHGAFVYNAGDSTTAKGCVEQSSSFMSRPAAIGSGPLTLPRFRGDARAGAWPRPFS